MKKKRKVRRVSGPWERSEPRFSPYPEWKAEVGAGHGGGETGAELHFLIGNVTVNRTERVYVLRLLAIYQIPVQLRMFSE